MNATQLRVFSGILTALVARLGRPFMSSTDARDAFAASWTPIAHSDLNLIAGTGPCNISIRSTSSKSADFTAQGTSRPAAGLTAPSPPNITPPLAPFSSMEHPGLSRSHFTRPVPAHYEQDRVCTLGAQPPGGSHGSNHCWCPSRYFADCSYHIQCLNLPSSNPSAFDKPKKPMSGIAM